MARVSSKYFATVIAKFLDAKRKENIVIDSAFKEELRSKVLARAMELSASAGVQKSKPELTRREEIMHEESLVDGEFSTELPELPSEPRNVFSFHDFVSKWRYALALVPSALLVFIISVFFLKLPVNVPSNVVVPRVENGQMQENAQPPENGQINLPENTNNDENQQSSEGQLPETMTPQTDVPSEGQQADQLPQIPSIPSQPQDQQQTPSGEQPQQEQQRSPAIIPSQPQVEYDQYFQKYSQMVRDLATLKFLSEQQEKQPSESQVDEPVIKDEPANSSSQQNSEASDLSIPTTPATSDIPAVSDNSDVPKTPAVPAILEVPTQNKAYVKPSLPKVLVVKEEPTSKIINLENGSYQITKDGYDEFLYVNLSENDRNLLNDHIFSDIDTKNVKEVHVYNRANGVIETEIKFLDGSSMIKSFRISEIGINLGVTDFQPVYNEPVVPQPSQPSIDPSVSTTPVVIPEQRGYYGTWSYDKAEPRINDEEWYRQYFSQFPDFEYQRVDYQQWDHL